MPDPELEEVPPAQVPPDMNSESRTDAKEEQLAEYVEVE